jgi:hypothetical protein
MNQKKVRNKYIPITGSSEDKIGRFSKHLSTQAKPVA